MKPWMTDNDVKLIEREILALNRTTISVLEWGSGGSTEHFTKFMRDHKIKYEWISIEYNGEWAKKVQSLKIPNTKVVLFDVGNSSLKQPRNVDMEDYINYPFTLNKKFDLVLVDGRRRRRCLINASKFVKDDGVVLLHDAQRKYYHCAFDNYKWSTFLSKTLWVGGTKNLVSIIMPARYLDRRLTFFRKTIDSIIKQSYQNWELIIACDGGEQTTIDLVLKTIKSYNDRRIRVFKSEKHRGPGVTRNMAIKFARGNYLSFHDTDDRSGTNRFERLLVDIGNDNIIGSDAMMSNPSAPSEDRIKSFGKDSLRLLLEDKKVRPPACLCTCLMTKKLFISLGGLESYMFSSDSIFMLKLGYYRDLMGLGHIPMVKKPLFVWVRQPESITTLNKNNVTMKSCLSQQRKFILNDVREQLLKMDLHKLTEKQIKTILGIKDNFIGLKESLKEIRWF